MKTYKKGFSTPITVLLVALLIVVGVYLYGDKLKNIFSIKQNITKNNTVLNSGKTCVTVDSDLGILCELYNAYIDGNKIAIIRLQDSLSKYYKNNKQDSVLLLDEIKNNKNPVDYRSYLIKILKFDKNNFSIYRKDLLSVISDNKITDNVRIQMIESLPKIYYTIYSSTKVKDNDDLFNVLIGVLNEQNDNLSLAVIKSMYGNMADLDMQKAVDTISNFTVNYKNNYKKTPNSLILALSILKNTGKINSSVTEGIAFVCSQNDSRTDILCRK